MEPAVYTPVSAAANLRRAIVISAVLGIGGVIVLSMLGHPLMGACGLVGLGLGAINNRLLQRSVLRYAADGQMVRKQFRHGVMGRLGLVTLIAFAIALLLRPDGLAVFVGLGVFQILMLIGAAVPVFRSLRPTS